MTQATGTSFDQHEPSLLISGQPLPIKYLQTAGATSGQSPVYNGSTVVWSTPGGFSLPTTETDSTTTTTTSLAVVTSALTTGIAESITASAMTTGKGLVITATAATLTTGRYLSANDGALEVFGVGANGHLYSQQTTAPTIVVNTQNGITAAAVTAGSTDTAGNITTTGTNNNGGDTLLVVTFNKTYTTTPKAVIIVGTNASGAKSQVYASVVAATAFTVDIPASASAGANPTFSYFVIA